MSTVQIDAQDPALTVSVKPRQTLSKTRAYRPSHGATIGPLSTSSQGSLSSSLGLSTLPPIPSIACNFASDWPRPLPVSTCERSPQSQKRPSRSASLRARTASIRFLHQVDNVGRHLRRHDRRLRALVPRLLRGQPPPDYHQQVHRRRLHPRDGVARPRRPACVAKPPIQARPRRRQVCLRQGVRTHRCGAQHPISPSHTLSLLGLASPCPAQAKSMYQVDLWSC